MTWLQEQWEDQRRPTEDEVALSISRIEFVVEDPPTTSGVSRVVETLRARTVYGGVHLARFRVVADDVAAWFLSRNRFHEYDIVSALVASSAMAVALPDVVERRLEVELQTKEHSPLTLDGDIARLLFQGGVYRDFEGTGAEAKGMGVAFSAQIIGDRYEEFRVD